MRLEEWRIKRTDTEQWMHHRQLPPDLRESVRKYDQYKWAATRGVDEEALLKGLPMDLRRDIKRHLCLDLVRRVSNHGIQQISIDSSNLDMKMKMLYIYIYTSGAII